MRNTAQDVSVSKVVYRHENLSEVCLRKQMHVHYKETSIGGLAATIKIPVSMPDC